VTPIVVHGTHVLHAACAIYRIPLKALLSRERRRWKEHVRARRAVIWLCRERLGSTWSELGRLLELHHTSVMAAHKRALAEFSTEDRFCEELAAIWKLAKEVPPVDIRVADTRVLH